MSNKSWEVGFYLRSPRNLLNDPNGLCQFRGRYSKNLIRHGHRRIAQPEEVT